MQLSKNVPSAAWWLVEVAINESTSAQWDKLLKHFGYSLHVCGDGRYDEHFFRRDFVENRTAFRFESEIYGTEPRCYGEALQHLQDNVPADEVLEFLEGAAQ